MGILVDIVKEESRNTNDGNTARKFFENPVKTAEIIGLDVSLIKRFAIILQAIASDEQIEPKKFDNFAKETALLFVELHMVGTLCQYQYIKSFYMALPLLKMLCCLLANCQKKLQRRVIRNSGKSVNSTEIKSSNDE